MYIIDFQKKLVSKIGLDETHDNKRNRFNTYFNYLTYMKTMEKSKSKNVIETCERRLNDMTYSVFFDNEFLDYLKTKKLEELKYKSL